jgi:hypothetical protein
VLALLQHVPIQQFLVARSSEVRIWRSDLCRLSACCDVLAVQHAASDGLICLCIIALSPVSLMVVVASLQNQPASICLQDLHAWLLRMPGSCQSVVDAAHAALNLSQFDRLFKQLSGVFDSCCSLWRCLVDCLGICSLAWWGARCLNVMFVYSYCCTSSVQR